MTIVAYIVTKYIGHIYVNSYKLLSMLTTETKHMKQTQNEQKHIAFAINKFSVLRKNCVFF